MHRAKEITSGRTPIRDSFRGRHKTAEELYGKQRNQKRTGTRNRQQKQESMWNNWTFHEDVLKCPKTANSKGTGRSSIKGGMRSMNINGQAADRSEGSSEWDEDNLALRVDETSAQLIALEGQINKPPLSVMVVSNGSPITIFARKYVRRLLESYFIFARPLPKNEDYVDYTG